MGLFNGETKMKAKEASPAVTECVKRLNELEQGKKKLLLEIGTKYYEDHKKDPAKETQYAKEMEEIIAMDKETVIIEMRKLALQGLRKCTACGNMLPLDSMFCNKCGEKQQLLNVTETMNKNVCPNCGAERDADNIFCTVCGYKLVD